ncbi:MULTISPECIES: hypothetical protein [Myxococcus]|uniref:hypothetical protein n=1 Tax=Myxococcus TaxID=32 RepID=UPI0002DA8E80|nr:MULTISPECIES: hypothetical protein [Myxococcus]QVW70494.1 hypothetical protein JTM82_13460 [Myxococcus xanthus DZ2]UEO03378.1 hypothetical protein K1515_29355 [Myxococcus xanthus DZ2]UYI16452.1 hypothetical protein N3T43_09085 [Myxococcus xanthus]UYI23814.1 hypothetical protein N1129_09085 [Myxococcus xanthus]
MLTFEFEPPDTFQCDCCGGTTTLLTRFICRDRDAYAVYYAQYSDSHPERVVSLAVGIGEWGEGSSESQRVAFALVLRQDAENWMVTVKDSAESPWKEASGLGRMLDREEALAHPWLTEVFHITDHVVKEDSEVLRYFNPTDAS